MPSWNDCSDEVLMCFYMDDVEGADRELYRRLAPSLFAMARAALRDDAEAEDVVQRTFLQVHRSRHRFRQDARLRPWFFTIGMNAVRDALRRRKRRRETPLVNEESQEWNIVERRDRVRHLRAALKRLPTAQRQAIELHWIEERPFSEVARILGASVSAVKVRAHRGYGMLRAELAAGF